jgi:hypothetical protein
VQGEDDSMTLEYMRKPAVVQRVINSQINEIVGGGRREAVPDDMLPYEQRGRRHHDDNYEHDDDDEHDRQQHDTPPFGVGGTPSSDTQRTDPGAPPNPRVPPPGAVPFEIRDRLIELDDLRRRGILSEEEFAAKKSQLLDRI